MKLKNKKNFRSDLSRTDWDFAGTNGNLGLSAYHWYPARFVPPLAGILINYFSEPGDIILDPFCGSGTTLSESYKLGRVAVGIDINPIAVMMTQAKLVEFKSEGFARYQQKILKEARASLIAANGSISRILNAGGIAPNLEENIKWYEQNTLCELISIWTAIKRNKRSKYYKVGITAFSSILISSHSQEKHWGWVCDNVLPKSKIYKDAFRKFSNKMEVFARTSFEEKIATSFYKKRKIDPKKFEALQGSSIDLLKNYSSNHFDLIVTSPPYYNMTDYIYSQRLSLYWLEVDLKCLRNLEIGARSKRGRKKSLSEFMKLMNDCFSEISRVLKNKKYCCVVIGESPSYKSYINEFIEICRLSGLMIQKSFSRKVPPRRSLTPSLSEEQIIIFKKER